jgi:hypothetical protein
MENRTRLADAALAAVSCGDGRPTSSSMIPADEVRADDGAVRQGHVVLSPLTDLTARDLGGGGVFHQVVDGHRT